MGDAFPCNILGSLIAFRLVIGGSASGSAELSCSFIATSTLQACDDISDLIFNYFIYVLTEYIWKRKIIKRKA
jgi:hypothetical protein